MVLVLSEIRMHIPYADYIQNCIDKLESLSIDIGHPAGDYDFN